jgi:hypothetical protein
MVSQRIDDIAGTSIDQKRGLDLILGRLASRYNGARKTQAGGQGKEAEMNFGGKRTVYRGEMFACQERLAAASDTSHAATNTIDVLAMPTVHWES